MGTILPRLSLVLLAAVIIVKLVATLPPTACSSADPPIPDQLVINDHPITQVHDQPCPEQGEPVSRYWRDVLLAEVDRYYDVTGKWLDIDLGEIDATDHGGSRITFGEWNRGKCTCIHAYIQLFRYGDRCAQADGLRCQPCV